MKYIIPLIIILFSTQCYGYPVIASQEKVNHTESVSLVNSIPLKFIKYVDFIEFASNDKKLDFRGRSVVGIVYFSWNRYNCYNVRIIILSNYNQEFILWHELGHIYEACVLKQYNISEAFADHFANTLGNINETGYSSGNKN